LLDPDEHPVTIDIGELERYDLRGSQAGGITQTQDRPVLDVRRRGEQPTDLFRAQNNGARVLVRHGMSREFYLDAIKKRPINVIFRKIDAEMKKFELSCDAIICGYDSALEPYILHARSPMQIEDCTLSGYTATGTGSPQAISRLLFVTHNREADGARTLYECFDAKKHAEMAIGVGPKWDACIVTETGPHPISEEAKSLVQRGWAKANSSPFKTASDPDDLESQPDGWQQQLIEHVRQCCESEPRREFVMRTSSGMTFRGEL